MDEAQQQVRRLYEERGYTQDPNILYRGLVEEVGEIGAAMNDADPSFKKKPGRIEQDVEHELNDALVYLLALANAMGIQLKLKTTAAE